MPQNLSFLEILEKAIDPPRVSTREKSDLASLQVWHLVSHFGSVRLSFPSSRMKPIIPTSQGLRGEGMRARVRVNTLRLLVVTTIRKPAQRRACPQSPPWRKACKARATCQGQNERCWEAPRPPASAPLTHTHPPDDAAAGDGGVHHGDGLGELALEHAAGTRARGSRAAPPPPSPLPATHPLMPAGSRRTCRSSPSLRWPPGSRCW